MKGLKLIDIFKNGNIVIPIYLLKNYKKLKLEMEEFVFLMYLYGKGNSFLFNPNQFASDLNYDLTEVMNLIDVLTEKGFIRVEVVKNEKQLMEEVVLLDDFYQKVTLLAVDDVSQDTSNANSNIFEVIEKEFGRTLGSIECEIIKAWLDHHISEELIQEALKEAIFNGVTKLAYIDKILYEWGKAGIETVEDVEKMRKKRSSKNDKESESDVDLESLEWDWFDEDE